MADSRFTGGGGGPKAFVPGRGPADFGRDAYLATGAKLMLEAARLAMDEYAREIFDLWFGGTAPDVVVFDNPKWAAYMRAEPNLPRQIKAQLTAHAERLRDQVNTGDGRVRGTLNETFHAVVGSKEGEYRTGYDVLHGSNKDAGDFGITGSFSTIRPGPPGTGYTVTYENLTFVFNDIVDVNKRWKADAMLGKVAANMARSLGGPPPKDYTLRIRWRAEQGIRIEMKSDPMRPLQTFPNR